MARIRTIKPEFWTDANVVSVSPFARLLFIGMWNFADDVGNIENSPPQLKMRILPNDQVEVVELLQELVTTGLLREYSVSGTKYFNIKGFTKHQVINKPSATRFPPPTLPEDSRTEWNGMEGSGKEKAELVVKERIKDLVGGNGAEDDKIIEEAREIMRQKIAAGGDHQS